MSEKSIFFIIITIVLTICTIVIGIYNIIFRLFTKFPDLLITLSGAFVGVIGAWIVSFNLANWQLKKQIIKEEENDLELLKIKYTRVLLELEDNEDQVDKLLKITQKSDKADVYIWNWLNTIIDSLSFKFYDNLIHSGLNKYLDKNFDDELYIRFKELKELVHRVKEYRKAHYYYRRIGDTESIEIDYKKLKEFLHSVKEQLKYSTEKLRSESGNLVYDI